MNYFFKFFFLFSLSGLSFALVQVDVNFTHKRGLEDQLFLQSELHRSYLVYENEKKTLPLKDGFSLEIQTHLANSFSDYGPMPVFKLKSKVYYENNLLSESEKLIELGKKNIISFNKTKGEHIELVVIPKFTRGLYQLSQKTNDKEINKVSL